MDTNLVVAALIRWVHILSAVTAVGGTVFMRLVLYPSVRATLTDEQHMVLRERIMRRWPKIVHACIGLLIATGLYNFLVQAIPAHRGQGLYHALFGAKLLLAFAVFFLAVGLSGRSPALASLRKNGPKWMVVSILLASAVVLVSATLRNIPHIP